MKLQLKLIVAFSILLLLVAGTTASGWFAMRNMTRMSKQLAAIDSAMSALQYTQIANMRYQTSKDTSHASAAQSAIKDASTYLTDALNYVERPAQKDNISKALVDIDKFAKALDLLIANTEKSVKLTAHMDSIRTKIGKTSDQTLNSLYENIKMNYREHTFTAFYLMNQVDSKYYFTTAYAAQFLADPTPEKAKKVQVTLADAQKQAVAAESIFTVAANKAAAQSVITDLQAYSTSLSEVIALSVETGKIIDTIVTLSKDLSNIGKTISTVSEELLAQSQDTGNKTNLTVLVAAIIIGVAITLLLTRNVTRQLGKDPGELAIIATRVTNGDYDIDDGSPRVGVYDNIVNMVTALKTNIENAQQASEQAKQESARATEAMKTADAASKDAQTKRDNILVAADKLADVASVVSSAAEELSAQIEQSERGAAEQASRVSETATAMEEMNSTVLEVARNAASANNGGLAMREKALEGATVVDSSVAEVQKARADALTLKDDMNVLSEQAQSIGQIMNVISDIADQTNLLALNAAIEAARAGEAGRGFAVVADEVRKLAEKTMQSTTDVGNAIKSIQASAAKNMAQVDATVKNIEISTEHAEKSGLSLRQIVEMVDISVSEVSSIAAASEQQSATSEEINNSIAQVSTIAAETARAMQEAAQAVSDLSHQAQVLSRLIEEMRKD